MLEEIRVFSQGQALGGKLALESPSGRGTTISIELPPGPPPAAERLTM